MTCSLLYHPWSLNPRTLSPPQAVSSMLCQLPTASYRELDLLFRHMRRVLSQQATNKMTAESLAMIFGPTLFRSPYNAEEDIKVGPGLKRKGCDMDSYFRSPRPMLVTLRLCARCCCCLPPSGQRTPTLAACLFTLVSTFSICCLKTSYLQNTHFLS